MGEGTRSGAWESAERVFSPRTALGPGAATGEVVRAATGENGYFFFPFRFGWGFGSTRASLAHLVHREAFFVKRGVKWSDYSCGWILRISSGL
jgi:hypothetical protein